MRWRNPTVIKKAATPTYSIDLELEIEADLNNGVVPVPFIGTTWQTRNASYWRRRVGAVVVMLLALALAGTFAVGFTIGILRDQRDATHVTMAVLYDLT